MSARFDPKKRPSPSSSRKAPSRKASQGKESVKDIVKTAPKKVSKKVSTKTKVSTTTPADAHVREDAWKRVHQAYTKSRSKNLFRGLLLGILSIFILGLVVISLLPILWSVDINLSGVVTRFLPESIA